MKNLRFVVAAMAAIGTTAALATLPENQVINYLIRADPLDEQSDVLFEVSLDLTAVDSDGNQVKWEVSEARFTEVDSNGMALGSWTKSSPTVTSNDGYWWVEHQDFDEVLAEEFYEPPTLEGIAPPDGSDENLEYYLTSGTLTQTEAEMYGGRVAGLSHVFGRQNEVDPVVDGDDEPAEVDPGSAPPS